ncbi:MAG: type II toxin-antitoxin system Phd/YefM family antitoxin [Actinomycetota bacterium]
MTTIGVKELKTKASEILERAASGESFVVTKRGRPLAAMVPIDADDWEDQIIQRSKAIAQDLLIADQDLAEGRATPFEEAFSRLKAKQPS